MYILTHSEIYRIEMFKVVGDHINTMKSSFLFKFWLLTSFQVIKEKLFLIDSMFMCIHAI